MNIPRMPRISWILSRCKSWLRGSCALWQLPMLFIVFQFNGHLFGMFPHRKNLFLAQVLTVFPCSAHALRTALTLKLCKALREKCANAMDNGHRNSWFTHLFFLMVIFHSYVSLPEGNFVANGMSIVYVAIFCAHQWCISGFPTFSIAPQLSIWVNPSQNYRMVGGLEFGLFSQKYWECHHPNWLSYFSEGWPNHQPEEGCPHNLVWKTIVMMGHQ